jgi:two-component system, OmpR family, sensor kinase
MSLRLRLALFGTAVVALTLLLFGVLLWALVSRSVTTTQDDALRARAGQAVASLDRSSPVAPVQPVAPSDLGTSTDIYLEVFDRSWSVLYSTAELNGSPPGVGPVLRADAGTASLNGVFATENGFRLYAIAFDGGYVVTGQSLGVPQSNLNGIVVFLIVSAVPALAAALLASWLVAGRALRPLRSVTATAEDIGRTRDFGRRLTAPGSRDEVARLAASFNGMLNRLQDAFESQRRFVADASHELRTPLTTIQTNAGLLASRTVPDEVRVAAVSDIVEESGRMTRLIDRLLTLARADSGLTLRLAALRLGPVVEEVCRQAGAAHPASKLAVETTSVVIDGDEDAMRQLLWILLDNAFRYASSSVEVHLHGEGGWGRLVVADDGPGVPANLRERVFERFYRADSSRTGSHSGLGLSIATWIVAQHRGRIVVGDAKLGGAAFLVDLPLLRSS